MSDKAPLILTVQLNKEAFGFFSALRKAHFPPKRNFLEAHLTLFHHLPANEKTIAQTISSVAAGQSIINLPVTAVVSIGRGVAYKIDSPELIHLHRSLQQQWQQWLIPQDKQRLWPHVTVQNKVSAPEAKQLQQQLSATFSPFSAYGQGFSLWEYAGGPWNFIESFPFKQERTTAENE